MKRLKAAKSHPVMVRFKAPGRGGGKYVTANDPGWSSGVEANAEDIDDMENFRDYLEQFELEPDDVEAYSLLVYPIDK